MCKAVGVVRYKELKVENDEVTHTLGGVGEGVTKGDGSGLPTLTCLHKFRFTVAQGLKVTSPGCEKTQKTKRCETY